MCLCSALWFMVQNIRTEQCTAYVTCNNRRQYACRCKQLYVLTKLFLKLREPPPSPPSHPTTICSLSPSIYWLAAPNTEQRWHFLWQCCVSWNIVNIVILTVTYELPSYLLCGMGSFASNVDLRKMIELTSLLVAFLQFVTHTQPSDLLIFLWHFFPDNHITRYVMYAIFIHKLYKNYSVLLFISQNCWFHTL